MQTTTYNPPSRAYLLLVRLPLFLLLGVLVTMFVFGKRGYLDLRRMKMENQRLSSQIADATTQKLNLQNQVAMLQLDKQEQEKVVREVLGYIKPKEWVVEFE